MNPQKSIHKIVNFSLILPSETKKYKNIIFLKTQQRFLVFGTCFDVSNIIISHNEYIRFTE